MVSSFRRLVCCPIVAILWLWSSCFPFFFFQSFHPRHTALLLWWQSLFWYSLLKLLEQIHFLQRRRTLDYFLRELNNSTPAGIRKQKFLFLGFSVFWPTSFKGATLQIYIHVQWHYSHYITYVPSLPLPDPAQKPMNMYVSRSTLYIIWKACTIGGGFLGFSCIRSTIFPRLSPTSRQIHLGGLGHA